jgi:hypothetical protein
LSTPDVEMSVVVEKHVVSITSDDPNVVFIESGRNFVEISAAGPQGPAGDGVEEEMFDMEIDSSNASSVYIGYAQPGTAKSAAAWRIKRVTDTGTLVSIDWAGGTANFVNIWDDRSSYTYGP